MLPMLMGALGGAGLGLIKNEMFDRPAHDRAARLQAITAMYSPWTKIDPFKVAVPDANAMGAIMQGATSGADFMGKNSGALGLGGSGGGAGTGDTGAGESSASAATASGPSGQDPQAGGLSANDAFNDIAAKGRKKADKYGEKYSAWTQMPSTLYG